MACIFYSKCVHADTFLAFFFQKEKEKKTVLLEMTVLFFCHSLPRACCYFLFFFFSLFSLSSISVSSLWFHLLRHETAGTYYSKIFSPFLFFFFFKLKPSIKKLFDSNKFPGVTQREPVVSACGRGEAMTPSFFPPLFLLFFFSPSLAGV